MSGINLESLANGAMQEIFNRDLEKIAENIQDKNTSSKVKRKMTITITLSPDENRELVDMDIQSKIVLAPIETVKTKVFMEKNIRDGKVSCVEWSGRKMKGQIGLDEVNATDKQDSDNDKIVTFNA